MSVFLAMVHPLTTLAGTGLTASALAPAMPISFFISSARRPGSFRSRSSRCFAASAWCRHAPMASLSSS